MQKSVRTNIPLRKGKLRPIGLLAILRLWPIFLFSNVYIAECFTAAAPCFFFCLISLTFCSSFFSILIVCFFYWHIGNIIRCFRFERYFPIPLFFGLFGGLFFVLCYFFVSTYFLALTLSLFSFGLKAT